MSEKKTVQWGSWPSLERRSSGERWWQPWQGGEVWRWCVGDDWLNWLKAGHLQLRFVSGEKCLPSREGDPALRETGGRTPLPPAPPPRRPLGPLSRRQPAAPAGGGAGPAPSWRGHWRAPLSARGGRSRAVAGGYKGGGGRQRGWARRVEAVEVLLWVGRVSGPRRDRRKVGRSVPAWRGRLGSQPPVPPLAVPRPAGGGRWRAWWTCSAGGFWSARTGAAWTPRRPCRTRLWACTSPPAGARPAATSPPSSATSTRSCWRRPSPPPLSRSSSSPPTTAPRRWRATCGPCTGTGWPCPSTTPTSCEYRRRRPPGPARAFPPLDASPTPPPASSARGGWGAGGADTLTAV